MRAPAFAAIAAFVVLAISGLTLTAPTAAADDAPAWEFLSTSAIGARAFLEAHPTWDGRGVVIAIIDTGIDPAIAGLTTTPDGRPKVLDLRDFSGQGDVTLEVALFSNDAVGPGVHGAQGPWLRGTEALSPAPVVGTTKIGYFRESALAGSDVRDMDGNGREDGEFGVLVYESAGKSGVRRHIVVDTDGDLRLDDERVRADFLEQSEVFSLGPSDARDRRAPLALALNLWEDRPNVVTFVFDDSAHGSHVAGIAAGHAIGGVAGQNGIAPGAQVLSLKIGNNQLSGGATTSGSMWNAWNYAARWSTERGVPVVAQMSYGIGSETEGHSRMEAEIDRLLESTPMLLGSVTNGNEGPGLSTAGLPSCARHVIAAGAVMNKTTARDIYGVELPQDFVFDFSSRGAEFAKPDLVTPGFAASTVPAWREGADVMRGTSMAAPQVAGAAALLMSAALAEKLPVQGAWVKAALRRGAVPIAGATVLDQGPGLVNVTRAFEVYRALAGRGITEPVAWSVETASPDLPSGEGPAAHWRGVSPPFPPAKQDVTVGPVFAPTVTAQQRSDFYRAFDLVATAPFVRPDRSAVYTKAASEIAFGLVYDAKALARPGLYTARILAFDKSLARAQRDALGPDWDFPVSVVVPYQPVPGETLALPRIALDASRIERVFVRVPMGATGMVVRTSVPSGTLDRVRTYVHDPEGRREILPWAGRTGKARIEKRIDGRDLLPGTWEIVLVADRDNATTLGVDLEVGFDALALDADALELSAREGGPPKGSLELVNRGSLTFEGRIEASLVGFRLTGEKKTDDGQLSMPLELGPEMGSVDLVVSTDADTWNAITDVAVRVVDGKGEPLVSDGMSYRRVHATFQHPTGDGVTKATLRIDAAIADPDDDGGALPFTIERTYRFASPIALELGPDASVTLYPDRPRAFTFSAASAPPAKPEGAHWVIALRAVDAFADRAGAALELVAP